MNRLSKWLLKRRIKETLRFGNDLDANFLFKTIHEIVCDLYPEANYHNRLGFLLDKFFKNDDTFQKLTSGEDKEDEDRREKVKKAVIANCIDAVVVNSSKVITHCPMCKKEL